MHEIGFHFNLQNIGWSIWIDLPVGKKIAQIETETGEKFFLVGYETKKFRYYFFEHLGKFRSNYVCKISIGDHYYHGKVSHFGKGSIHKPC